MDTPKIGEVVSVIVDPRTNNGESVAAGIVTKVVSEESDDSNATVNLRVFLDTGDDARLNGVVLTADRPEHLGGHSGHLAFRS